MVQYGGNVNKLTDTKAIKNLADCQLVVWSISIYVCSPSCIHESNSLVERNVGSYIYIYIYMQVCLDIVTGCFHIKTNI